MVLQLTRQQHEVLIKEARNADPVEACAMLFGESTQDEARVKKIVVTSNMLRSPVRFMIDPETIIAAFDDAEKEGFEFIGLFHSHPAPAEPSSVDLRYMKLWGRAYWLILSLTNYCLAAYQIENGSVKKIPVRIVV